MYRTPTGNIYPSVTTVLSSQSKKWIDEWKRKVGEDEAARISNYATSRGNSLHSLVENYLNNKEIDLLRVNPISLRLFLQIKLFLDEGIQEVWGLEKSLYSDDLKIAGRTDIICKINDTMCILDLKTSTKKKKEAWVQNYFLQSSAYSYAFNELFGIEIKKIVILITNESIDYATIMIKNPKDYIDKFKKNT